MFPFLFPARAYHYLGFLELIESLAPAIIMAPLLVVTGLPKVSTERGWFELNDLKSTNSLTHPPGSSDTSVVVLLLIAEDKLL